MRAQKVVNVDELTNEEKMKLAEVFQQVLDAEGDECHDSDDCTLVPTLEAVNAEPLQCRNLDNQKDNKRLVEIVRRIPVTDPILIMEGMANVLIDRAYRLGYKDGVVDTYYNFEGRGIKVPSITELENY